MLIHSHRTVVVVLAVVIFSFDNLREKRSVPLTSQVLHVSKILVAHWFENHCKGLMQLNDLHRASGQDTISAPRKLLPASKQCWSSNQQTHDSGFLTILVSVGGNFLKMNCFCC